MTLLNSASEGLPAELIVLARAAAHAGPLSRSDLLDVCAVDGTERLGGCLSRWIALGLFSESEKGIEIARPYRPRPREGVEEWSENFPALCRQLALSPTAWAPLFDGASGTSADLVRGLCWILSQEIYTFPTVFRDVEALEARQTTETMFGNDVRWNALRFWARFLGFASSHRGFFVDPTVAVRDAVDQILEPGKAMGADLFIDRLGQLLPVLDGGSARRTVEERLDSRTLNKPKDHELSQSLSLALRRLQLSQTILLEKPSDTAQGFVLLGSGNRQGISFTHVRRRGK